MKISSIVKVILALVIGVGGLFAAATWYSNQPGELDSFAQCLGDNGAKFYGAFWCPHCQNQKAMFGRSEKHLPYIECSTPDGQNLLEVCAEAEVEGFPTWDFPDGSRLVGEIPLATLAEKTECERPR